MVCECIFYIVKYYKGRLYRFIDDQEEVTN